MKAIYYAIINGELEPDNGWEMDDELKVALNNGPEETRRYMHLLTTRKFPKAAGVLKLEGYEKMERGGGRPIHIEPTSQSEGEEIKRLYSDGFETQMERIEQLEAHVAKKLGLEKHEVLITFPRNFGHNLQNEIIIHRTNEGNRLPDLIKLGEIYRDMNDEIKHDIEGHWAVRLCVPEDKREQIYGKIRKIGMRNLILDG